MAFNIGVNVLEVEGKSAPAIQGAPTSVAGFIVRTRRGPTDKAVRVSNFQQFVRRFGGYHPDYMGAYCVHGFFSNGGQEAYIARVLRGNNADDQSGNLPVAASHDFLPQEPENPENSQDTEQPEDSQDSESSLSFKLTAGYRGQEDPGKWGEEIRIDIKSNQSDDNSFDLTVKLHGQVVESWENLTLKRSDPNYIVTRLNDDFSGSIYVRVDQNTVSTAIPQNQSDTPLQGGSDGDDITSGDYQSTLHRFDTVSIQLLSTPDITDSTLLKSVMTVALDYCADENIKGDCLFVGHTPFNRDVEGAKTFGQGLRNTKRYGALYWPWIKVVDPIGSGRNPTKEIPPVGHVMGVYARVDQTRGVWKAPAGNEAVLRGALAIERDITDVDHTDLVKNGSVNGIRRISGAGIVIDASRTLSTDPRWLYVNVRLLFNYVKTSLRESLRWVKQEPNRENLWNKIKYNTVTPFLQRLYQAGAFGPGAPEDVFTVICGPENNPAEQIQLGNLKVEVYFFASRPAESIVITLSQQDSGATASEQ